MESCAFRMQAREVTLAGWVQRARKMGRYDFCRPRDRYGITQLVFNEADNADLCGEANKLGREYCIQVKGVVNERQSKNSKIPTGDIEIIAKELRCLVAQKLLLSQLKITQTVVMTSV